MSRRSIQEDISFSYKKEIYNKKKMRDVVQYQKNIDKNIETKLKHLIRDGEGYKIDSEIFSNWFESLTTK